MKAEGRKDGRTESAAVRAQARGAGRRVTVPPFRPTVHEQLPLLAPAPRPLPVLDQRLRGAEFVRLEPRSAMNSPAATGMGFWSINPYVGCEFGCTYCYARETHKWTVERRTDGLTDRRTDGQKGRGTAGLPESPQGPRQDRPSVRRPAGPSFEHQIFVKSTLPEVLLRTLDPSRVGGATIVIGTATDPYQPAERKFRVTRRVLEALLRFQGLSIGIITKSPLVTRDIDVLQRLAARHDVSVNISLASVDATLIRRIEKRSPVPLARLRALHRLTDAGIYAGLLVAPILPGITDDRQSLAALMIAGKAAGAKYVAGQPLRLGASIAPHFFPMLQREFPELAERYRRHYRGGRYVSKEYKQALMQRIRELQEEYGFPTRPAPHHEPALEQEADVQWTLL